MKVLDHTEERQPTFIRDVYEALIGKEVTVKITGASPAHGKLEAYNGYILQVVDTGMTTYISVGNVAAISEDN